MTDDPTAGYGLGALESPPDDRDWPIDLAYASAGIDAVASPPGTYSAPGPFPPVYAQGGTPMCVAYSNGAAKAWQDLRDTGLFAPAFELFFSQIGGTPSGADPRAALQRMLDFGYPPAGSPGSASLHRIAAYYAVPVERVAIQSAIMAFGPVLFSSPWFKSWFHPRGGVLPVPDAQEGRHEYEVRGWDAAGFRIRNSWGAGWSQGGEATMPWSMLHLVTNVWKALDRIEAPARPRTYTLRIAAGAHVKHYALHGACIGDTKEEEWGKRPSTAACSAPRVRRGCSNGQATVVHVPRGAFAGREVRIGTPGVTATWR